MNDIYAYQKEFVDRAIDLLDSKGKAAVVLPTGVGKSYIAADVIRHYLRENECVIWCINHLIICETQKEKFIGYPYGRRKKEWVTFYVDRYCKTWPIGADHRQNAA